MIFVTVGSQMPFDRLIRAIDRWAMSHTDQQVIAQIGESKYVPQGMAYNHSLSPADFARMMIQANVVIAHAGMGTIINAAEFGKPLVLLPRLGSLWETRNDHQVATAKWLQSKPGIFVANNEDELPTLLARALADSSGIGLSGAVPCAMIAKLKSVISLL